MLCADHDSDEQYFLVCNIRAHQSIYIRVFEKLIFEKKGLWSHKTYRPWFAYATGQVSLVYIYYCAQKCPGIYAELSGLHDKAWSTVVIDINMDIVRIVFWMTDKPCSRRYLGAQLTASAWRRLVSGRFIWIPNTTLTRGRIVPSGNVQLGVAVTMEVRFPVTVFSVFIPWVIFVFFPFA
jgi:hypothetical protein